MTHQQLTELYGNYYSEIRQRYFPVGIQHNPLTLLVLPDGQHILTHKFYYVHKVYRNTVDIFERMDVPMVPRHWKPIDHWVPPYHGWQFPSDWSNLHGYEVPPEGLHLPQGFVPPESWKQDPKTLGWAEELSDSSESDSEGLEESE